MNYWAGQIRTLRCFDGKDPDQEDIDLGDIVPCILRPRTRRTTNEGDSLRARGSLYKRQRRLHTKLVQVVSRRFSTVSKLSANVYHINSLYKQGPKLLDEGGSYLQYIHKHFYARVSVRFCTSGLVRLVKEFRPTRRGRTGGLPLSTTS